MKGRNVQLKDYFARQPGVETELMIRGQKSQKVVMLGARLHVKAHGKKRFVVALKYEGESEHRFLVAADLSWRHGDIARAYTPRWLVEVFIEDWKAHGGWSRLSKHRGEKGSTQGVILSLLCDHMLFLHPEQSTRLKNKQPGLPVGCLTERMRTDALVDTIAEVVRSEDPQSSLEQLSAGLRDVLPDRKSTKHMAGLDLGRMEATPSLKYKAAA